MSAAPHEPAEVAGDGSETALASFPASARAVLLARQSEIIEAAITGLAALALLGEQLAAPRSGAGDLARPLVASLALQLAGCKDAIGSLPPNLAALAELARATARDEIAAEVAALLGRE